MTSDPRDPQQSPAAPDEVLADLLGVLGEVLRIATDGIDPEQSFRSLGLDSLLTAQFVAMVNLRYGAGVEPTDLYEYPTPAAFADLVVCEAVHTP